MDVTTCRGESAIIARSVDTWLPETDHISQDVVNQYYIYRQNRVTGMLGLGLACRQQEAGRQGMEKNLNTTDVRMCSACLKFPIDKWELHLSA